MRRLLLVELVRLLPAFVILYAFASLAFYIYDFSALFFIIPLFGIVIANHNLRRSSWYLNLPWSRAKVIGAVLLQLLVVFIVNLVIAVLFFLYEGKIFSGEKNTPVWILLTIYSGISFYSLWRLLAGVSVAKLYRWSDALEKNRITAAITAAVVSIVWYFDLFIEPTFIVFFLIFLGIQVFAGLAKEFVVPRTTALMMNRVTNCIGAGLFILIVGSLIAIVNFGDTTKYQTGELVSWLGRFPSFVSDQRALDLFLETQAGVSPTFNRKLKFLRENLSVEQWKQRTLACKSSDCLELSSELVDTSNLTPQQLEDRFLVLMNSCEFQLKEDGRNTCVKDVGMEFQYTKNWLTLLEKDGVLNGWILSGDPKKQILAMKGFPFSISGVQEQAIRGLESSQDPRLKTAATLFLNHSQTFKSSSLNCENEKDKKHAVCRFVERGYSL